MTRMLEEVYRESFEQSPAAERSGRARAVVIAMGVVVVVATVAAIVALASVSGPAALSARHGPASRATR